MGWDERTVQIHMWDEKENNTVEGELVGFDTFTGGEFGECLKYKVITADRGLLSFIGGTAFDKMFEQADIVNGDTFKTTYHGKRDIGGGQRVNVFKLFKWVADPKEAKK